ncbi:MAG: sodium:calcium antiporter [Methyloligellaceae bacterium]
MLTATLAALPLLLNLALFAACAAAIWLAGTRLSRLADAISDRLRIGKALMGLVFLATATSLPEIVTVITAALANDAQLVLSNMFGGITFQTAVLAIADASVPLATLTFYPRKTTHALEGILLMLLLSVLLAIARLGEIGVIWNIGLGSLLLAAAYAGCIVLLRTYDATSPWVPIEVPEESEAPLGTRTARELDALPEAVLMWRSILMTTVILVAGVALIALSEALARQTGLGQSFVGVTLLAASTSLPELSTTITAVRLGSFTLAISNVFGSNLILIVLLLPADILYRSGLLLEEMDDIAAFAIFSGIAVTGIYVIGLLARQKPRLLGMGIDSLIVLIAYLASLAVLYELR